MPPMSSRGLGRSPFKIKRAGCDPGSIPGIGITPFFLFSMSSSSSSSAADADPHSPLPAKRSRVVSSSSDDSRASDAEHVSETEDEAEHVSATENESESESESESETEEGESEKSESESELSDTDWGEYLRDYETDSEPEDPTWHAKRDEIRQKRLALEHANSLLRKWSKKKTTCVDDEGKTRDNHFWTGLNRGVSLCTSCRDVTWLIGWKCEQCGGKQWYRGETCDNCMCWGCGSEKKRCGDC